MQENNFEKQVQQKMEELKFQPSDEVWQKVAANIAKGKNDRRIIAFILLLLIFISSVIFITRNQTGERKNNMEISENLSPEPSNATQSDQPTSRQKVGSLNDPNNVVKEPNNVAKSLMVIPVENLKGNQQKTKAALNHVGSVTTLALVSGNGSDRMDRAKSNNEKDTFSKNRNTLTQKRSNGKVTTSISSSSPGEVLNEKGVSNDFFKANKDALIPGEILTAMKEPFVEPVNIGKVDFQQLMDNSMAVMPAIETGNHVEVKSPNQIKQKSNWDFGLNFSVGLAATQNGYLGITGSGDENKAFFDAGQVTSGNPGQPISRTYTPSAIKPGLGLVVGMFMRKSIASKTGLLFGLNYKYYSSSMNVGGKVDSNFYSGGNTAGLVSFYYSSGNSNRYKNNFHFIELPVTMQFKLSKQSKLPVYLNTGISVAQLVATNALQFQTSTGAYYNRNDLFNKTQVNVSAGLLFALSGKTNNSFFLGPDVNFSLNKMASSGLYNDRRYSYFGVLLQKRIGGK